MTDATLADAALPRKSAEDARSRPHHAPTPVDLVISPRDRRFGRDRPEPQKRWWLGGDPVATAFFNALSVTFPKGEAYFVEAVKQHRGFADEKLAGEIRAFTMQEVMHSREHVAFNRAVIDAGYDVKPLEDDVDRALDIGRGRPAIAQLAATMALEHFTAILAHELLANPSILAPADAESAAMWKWHAIEEVEHKGVAYDTWLAATRDWSRFKRWKVKSLVMLMVTRDFLTARTRGTLELLRQDGLTGAGVKWKLFKYAMGNPGILRKVIWPWITYFLPRFHPWNEDDRELIALAESPYVAARLEASAVAAD